MEDFDWMYKIEYQLMLNTVHNRTRYDEALEDLGAGDKITEYYKQQLTDSEEAFELFRKKIVKLLEGAEKK